MVDPVAYLPKTGIELADVVRRFAPEYTSQYGHLMMPSQEKGTFGHRGLLHRSTGRAAVSMRRLRGIVLAFL